MIVISTVDKLVALDGSYKQANIWALSMSVTDGQLLKDAIHSKDGYAAVYLERGGRVQSALDKLSGKKMELPMLYVGGQMIGGEKSVEAASSSNELGKKLSDANAFAHTPDCTDVKGVASTAIIKIHHSH